MNNSRLFGMLSQHIILRGLIVAVWLVIFAVFFYAPCLFQYFYTAEDKVLQIYTFVGLIPKNTLKKFTESTGIQVRVTYFASNEELFAKFKINRGEGYDLVVVSDYMVELMRDQGLLAPIDLGKIENFKTIEPALLDRYFDPGNRYSVPLMWTAYGFGYNKKFFNDVEPTWDSIFKNPHANTHVPPYKITMPDDPREAFFYAAHYLFGSAVNLTTTQIDQIELLLRNQKQWVEAYTNDKMAYMLEAGILPLVITPAANFLKTLPLDGDYGFYVPLSGNLFVIETVAIPALSKKTKAAHACINFLISKDSALAGSKKYCYNPVNSAVYAELEPEIAERLQAFASPERIASMYLLRNDISLKRLETLWISVKSA